MKSRESGWKLPNNTRRKRPQDEISGPEIEYTEVTGFQDTFNTTLSF